MDFRIIYPCHVPMLPTAVPVTGTAVGSDGLAVTAVILITDSDLLQRFIKAYLPADGPHCQLKFTNAGQLATFLNRYSGYSDEVNPSPVTHVVIDPADFSKSVRAHPIPEILALLGRDQA